MQSLPFQRNRIAAVLPIDLKPAQVDPFTRPRSIRPFGDLTDPLPGSIVYVEGPLAIAPIHHLLPTDVQLVLKVPTHQRQVRHADHVAVRVIAVALFDFSGPGAIQSIVRCWIVIMASPPLAGGVVNDFQNVPYYVVFVGFLVSAHRLAIAGERLIHAWQVVPGPFRIAEKTHEFSSLRTNQAIDRSEEHTS